METDLADQVYAAKVARFLLSSYPNQAHDPEVFLTQLVILFTARRKSLLQAMTHPNTGLVSECQFLTVAAAKAWLDAHMPTPREVSYHRLFLPEPEMPPENPKLKAAALARWHEAKKAILSKATFRKGPKPLCTSLTPEHQALLDAYIANPENL